MGIQRGLFTFTRSFALRAVGGTVRVSLDERARRELAERGRTSFYLLVGGWHRLIGDSSRVVTLRVRRRF